MKKTLVALAVAAAVPAFAQAQTSIQLTGSVDVAVESLNKDANSSGKSDLQINDGIWGGSRVGIVGSEDLGNGRYRSPGQRQPLLAGQILGRP